MPGEALALHSMFTISLKRRDSHTELLVIIVVLLQSVRQRFGVPHSSREAATLTGAILTCLLSGSINCGGGGGRFLVGEICGLAGSGMCLGWSASACDRRQGPCDSWSMLVLRTRSRREGRDLRRGRSPSIHRSGC